MFEETYIIYNVDNQRNIYNVGIKRFLSSLL